MYKILILKDVFLRHAEGPRPAARTGANFQSHVWLTAAAVLIVVSTLAGPAAAQSDGASGGGANSIHVSQAVTPHPRAESDGAGERVETGWRVVVVTGQVRSRASGGDWYPVAEGPITGGRTRIETGDDGQLLLFNGRDSIAVSSGASLVLPIGQPEAGVMSIVQESGTARYDVQSRRRSGAWQRDLVDTGRPSASDAPSAERFEVETPYLAAIVKGTTFSVSVAQDQANVSVHEGLVAVRDTRTGQSRDIEAGRTGTVGRRSGVRVADTTPVSAADQPSRVQEGGQGGNSDAGDVAADGKIDHDDGGKDDDGKDADDDDDDGKDVDGKEADDDDDDGKDDDGKEADDDDGKDADDDDDGKDDDGKDADDDDGARTGGKDHGHGHKTDPGQQQVRAKIGCNPVGGCGGDRR